MLALTAGDDEVRLSADSDLTMGDLGRAINQLSAEVTSQMVALSHDDRLDLFELTISPEARERYARSGVALPSGHYPIPDARHLAVAKSYFKQGKHAGQSPAAIRAHINQRAKALGLPGLDDDEDDHPKRRHYTKPVQVAQRGQRVAADAAVPAAVKDRAEGEAWA